MAEVTEKDLRKAREDAGLVRWQVAQEIGVSEDTVRRWEDGASRPEPDDVYRLETLYKVRGLWHGWMRSHYESYRAMWSETPSFDRVTSAIMNVRHQLSDVLDMQNEVERGALAGRMPVDGYMKELTEAQAAIAAAMAQISHERR